MAVAAVEPLLPEPGEVSPLWASLDERVRQVAEAFPGRISVVALDLSTGTRYEFRPRDPYLPASTFKLPVTRTEQGSTPVTAGDEMAWWRHLWQLKQQRPEQAEELLRPLRQVAYHGRIGRTHTERSPLAVCVFLSKLSNIWTDIQIIY